MNIQIKMQSENLEIAEQMARAFSERNVDSNEVAKVLSHLMAHKDGREIFDFLRTVISDGRAVVRSGRTLGYYRQILEVCQAHLKPYQDDPARMALILGWAVRLMRFYKVEQDLKKPAKRQAGKSRPARKPQPPITPGGPQARHRGRVKWFNDRKGYGFIEQDDGPDVFVHHSAIFGQGRRTLQEGQRVEFDIVQDSKGPRAAEVVALE